MTAASGPLPGDFGVVGCHGGPWIDRVAEAAIRFGTDSPVNHAFLYAGNGQIIEARRHVMLSPVTEYDGITWSTGKLGKADPTDHDRSLIVAYARSCLGESYTLLDIAVIALAQRRLGRVVDSDDWIARRLSNDGRMICSQLVARAYLAAGIVLCPGQLPGLTSPGDLLDAMQRPLTVV